MYLRRAGAGSVAVLRALGRVLAHANHQAPASIPHHVAHLGEAPALVHLGSDRLGSGDGGGVHEADHGGVGGGAQRACTGMQVWPAARGQGSSASGTWLWLNSADCRHRALLRAAACLHPHNSPLQGL